MRRVSRTRRFFFAVLFGSVVVAVRQRARRQKNAPVVVVPRERRGPVVPAALEFLSVPREPQRDGVHDDAVGTVKVGELERELASATPDVQDGRARPDALGAERVEEEPTQVSAPAFLLDAPVVPRGSAGAGPRALGVAGRCAERVGWVREPARLAVQASTPTPVPAHGRVTRGRPRRAWRARVRRHRPRPARAAATVEAPEKRTMTFASILFIRYAYTYEYHGTYLQGR